MMSNDDELKSEDPSTRSGIELVDTDGNCIPDQIRIDISWLMIKLSAVLLCILTYVGL